MQQIIDPTFWDKRVPTMRELGALGLHVEGERYSLPPMESFNSMWELRSTYIERFGFAIPCREVLERMSVLSKSIVEVGAGTGFLAAQLSRFGVDVKATDPNTGDYKFKVGARHPVEPLGAKEAILAYPDRDVLSSWPSYEEDWLYEAVKVMQPGRLLFYIGESHGGCTADDQFHEFVEDTNEFERVEAMFMPQFYGIHDDLYVYRRKSGVLALT